MLELQINGKNYQFKAGIGFMRETNKRVTQVVQGTDQIKQVGLTYLVAGVIDGDVEELIDALDLMNKGMSPRITRQEIEDYIEDEDTDIEELFETVLDFFKSANVSKKVTNGLLAEVKKNQQQA